MVLQKHIRCVTVNQYEKKMVMDKVMIKYLEVGVYPHINNSTVTMGGLV